MKRFILIVSLMFIGISAQARTSTKTVNLVPMGQTFIGEGWGFLEGSLGLGLRSISGPDNGGGYWGLDLSVTVPLGTVFASPFTGIILASSFTDLFVGLKLPLGYRWPGTGKSMGFYMGIGPAGQMIASFGSDVNFFIFSFGAFGEIGWETNKTEGVGFHIGIRLGLSPFVYMPDQGFLPDSSVSELSCVFGMSWRRQKRQAQ